MGKRPSRSDRTSSAKRKKSLLLHTTNDIKTSGKQNEQSSTRLKKKRPPDQPCDVPKPSKSTSHKHDSTGEAALQLDNIRTLESKLVLMIRNRETPSNPTMLSPEMLQTLLKLLDTTNVPTVLSHGKSIPRALLMSAAAVDAVDGEQHSTHVGPLVDVLLRFAEGINVHVPAEDESAGKRYSRSSAFSNQRGRSARIESETRSKAGKWAANLLVGCIRGDVGGIQQNNVEEGLSSLQHSGLMRVFVSPRDTLDEAIVRQHIGDVLQYAEYLHKHSRHPADVHNVMLSLCSKLCIFLHEPWCISVIGKLITLTALPTSLRQDKALSDNWLPDNFIQAIFSDDAKAFLALPEAAQSTILRSSDVGRRLYVLHAEKQLDGIEGKDGKTSSEITAIVRPLGLAAAEDVNIHWELMDGVRREVCSTTEPFSVRTWRKRRYYRAILAEVLNIVLAVGEENALVREESPVISPLSRRLPFFVRPAVRHMVALFRVMDDFDSTRESRQTASRNCIRSVCSLLGLDEKCRISADMHAFLICIESLLERLCWACGMSLSVLKSDCNWTYSQGDAQVLQDITTLVSVVDTIRLPGGTSAETDDILVQKSAVLKATLEEMLIKSKLKIPRGSDGVRINGLLSFSIVGMMRESYIRGFRKALKCLEREEMNEFVRALGMAWKWSNQRSKVGNEYMENLKRALVTFSFSIY